MRWVFGIRGIDERTLAEINRKKCNDFYIFSCYLNAISQAVESQLIIGEVNGNLSHKKGQKFSLLLKLLDIAPAIFSQFMAI